VDRFSGAADRSYSFHHILMRDAVYSAVPKERRARDHERFGDALERRSGDRLGELEEIVGYHLEQAYRWVAELANHLVFAEPGNRAARELQADALEQLGYGAENATWRNFFLAGAGELRGGASRTLTARVPPDIVAGLSIGQLLDAMAIRLDGPRAWDLALRIDWIVTEPDEERAITVRNGVLRHRPGQHGTDADATLIVARGALDQLVLKTADLAELAQTGQLRVEGDGAKIGELLGLLDEPDPSFPIVTPRPTLSRD